MLDRLIDHLYPAFDKSDPVLLGFLAAYAQALEAAAVDVPLALEQATLATADGDWLDYWGMQFGVYRPEGMNDAAYLARIVGETTRPRANRFAIENAASDALGVEVMIDEPWRRIFTLDWSALSGNHKLKDGQTIGCNLIRPVALVPIDWTGVPEIVERNRATGVISLPAQSWVTGAIQVNVTPYAGIVVRHGEALKVPSRPWAAGGSWGTDSWGSHIVGVEAGYSRTS